MIANTPIELRTASAADAAALADAGWRFFSETYDGMSPADDMANHLEATFSRAVVACELALPAVEYRLAVAGGEIAGFIKMRDAEVPDGLAVDSTIEVQQLYVSPDHQRRGIGRLLMDEAVGAARIRGIDGIWLSVWEDAEWATRFYRAYGFTPLRKIDFRMGKSCFVDLLMWLPVSAAN